MFRSSTIIRELVLSLTKVILKHSVKLCPYRLCGGVAEHTTHTPLEDKHYVYEWHVTILMTILKRNFFHICTVHLDTIKVYYSPINTQVTV
jgi:hypothetical protein